jgi:hypothetical protein
MSEPKATTLQITTPAAVVLSLGFMLGCAIGGFFLGSANVISSLIELERSKYEAVGRVYGE